STKHKAAEQKYKNNPQPLQSSLLSFTNNNHDKINIAIIEAFTKADIPLDKLKTFFNSYCKNDISDKRGQQLLKRSYFLFKLYFFTLLSHIFANVTLAIIHLDGFSIAGEVTASVIYLILIPIGELIVILFGVFISLGALSNGSSGVLGIVYLIDQKYYVASAFTIIFLTMVLIQTILHIILTIQVYNHYKSLESNSFFSLNNNVGSGNDGSSGFIIVGSVINNPNPNTGGRDGFTTAGYTLGSGRRVSSGN
ncbi:12338_t:CDS:2, partial [Entrophospora sp. SA101]